MHSMQYHALCPQSHTTWIFAWIQKKQISGPRKSDFWKNYIIRFLYMKFSMLHYKMPTTVASGCCIPSPHHPFIPLSFLSLPISSFISFLLVILLVMYLYLSPTCPETVHVLFRLVFAMFDSLPNIFFRLDWKPQIIYAELDHPSQFVPVLWIRDILVRIRIRGFVALTN